MLARRVPALSVPAIARSISTSKTPGTMAALLESSMRSCPTPPSNTPPSNTPHFNTPPSNTPSSPTQNASAKPQSHHMALNKEILSRSHNWRALLSFAKTDGSRFSGMSYATTMNKLGRFNKRDLRAMKRDKSYPKLIQTIAAAMTESPLGEFGQGARSVANVVHALAKMNQVRRAGGRAGGRASEQAQTATALFKATGERKNEPFARGSERAISLPLNKTTGSEPAIARQSICTTRPASEHALGRVKQTSRSRSRARRFSHTCSAAPSSHFPLSPLFTLPLSFVHTLFVAPLSFAHTVSVACL